MTFVCAQPERVIETPLLQQSHASDGKIGYLEGASTFPSGAEAEKLRTELFTPSNCEEWHLLSPVIARPLLALFL